MSDPTARDSIKTGQPWRSDTPPPQATPPGALGWFLIATRGFSVVSILLLGVLGLLPLRGVEKYVAGARRPMSGPWVQGVCRACLWVMGLRWQRQGSPMRGPGAVVANHSSWLDILTLNAAMPVFFVSKAEVASWPGINILTRVTNTHFVVRDPKLAREQANAMTARLNAGHRLLFFPEGTSTDGQRVLAFKPTLFQAFLDPALSEDMAIQPVTVRYDAPSNRDPRFLGWWGDMALGPHLLSVLAAPNPGAATVILHRPVPIVGQDRKSLARITETTVRAALPH